MDRHNNKFRSRSEIRLDRRPVQTPGLAATGGVHAPLQHQVGGLSAEPEVTARNRQRYPLAERNQARQLGIVPPPSRERNMTDHNTGTREEWLAARLGLLKEEKELTRRSDELARRRQELPWVRIDKEYRFDTDAGSASLVDLFGGCSQLLIYHFMFGPDYTAGCPSCSSIADGFNGFVVHLANHDV